MKKCIVFLIAIFFADFLYAIDVSVDLKDASWGSDPAVVNAKAQFENRIRDGYSKFDKVDDLTRAFYNANVFAADGGFLRTAQGYKTFYVNVATSGGVLIEDMKSPGDFSSDFFNDYADKGDLYAGFGAEPVIFSAGINIGRFAGLDRSLYLSVKGGKFSFSFDDFDFDSWLLGFMVDYPLIESRSWGIAKWTGFNIGAGLTYYKTAVEWTTDKTPEIENEGLYCDPKLDTKADISGFIIPLELTTGFKILFFEIFGGAGLDIMTGGENKISYKADGDIRYCNRPEKGKVIISGDEEGDKDNMKFKIMAGVGFSLGPVKIEIPYSYYFDPDAFCSSLSISGGVAF